MPIIDPDQGIDLVDLADLANNQAAFANFYAGTAGGIKSRTILRYATRVARGLQHPAPLLNETSIIDGETWYERWTGSKWLPCTPIKVRASADQTVNNSIALVNSTQLFVPLPVANTSYSLEGLLRYSTNTTADIKFTFVGPAGATIVFGGPFLDTAAASATGSAFFGESIAPATAGAGGSGGTIVSPIIGSILTGGTTGVLTLQFAQNTLNASNTTLNAFSWLSVEAIS